MICCTKRIDYWRIDADVRKVTKLFHSTATGETQMAGRRTKSDISTVVTAFVSELEQLVESRIKTDFDARFAQFRDGILKGARSAKAALAQGSSKRGPKAGFKAELKPCPVCKTPNKARRFSYLCEDHRDKASLAKFKGAAKAASNGKAAKATGKAAAKATGKAAAKGARKAEKAEKASKGNGKGRKAAAPRAAKAAAAKGTAAKGNGKARKAAAPRAPVVVEGAEA